MTLRSAEGAAEIAAALDLRMRVFCGEQGVRSDEELDGRDEQAEHLVAIEEDGTILATCRLLHEPPATLRLGRMATAPEARGQGLAAALLALAEQRGREHGSTRIVLDAQLTAQRVYARAGYVAHGDVFDDARIPHIAMELRLA